MRMARAVGVHAVGIASVVGDPDELREAGADEVAPTVAAWVARHLAQQGDEPADVAVAAGAVTGSSGGRAIILADGDAPNRAALDASWPGWADDVTLVVAADGGARHAASLGLRIDRWVGDGDSSLPARIWRPSAPPASRSTSSPPRRTRPTPSSPSGRRSTPAPDRVTILGALGGPRLDHALANVALLAHPALGGRPAELLDAGSRVRLLRGPAAARPGDARTSTARPATSSR